MSHRDFLELVTAEEAHRRFGEAVAELSDAVEEVALCDAHGRRLARDAVAPGDVPAFDRANVDGYAVRAADTFGADEESPRVLGWNGEELAAGVFPERVVEAGQVAIISTGGVLPRGADAVVMVEHADEESGQPERVIVRRAVAPGAGVSWAGSDIARGEIVLREGALLTARETGTLAAMGLDRVAVCRRPRIGVLSTGDEIAPPGEPLRPGWVHDANLRIVADCLRELGCEPVELGVVGDDEHELRTRLRRGLELDGVIVSGGTSKGRGDLNVRVVEREAEVLAHGVAVQPGKPICLAVHDGRPVVVLPGFPTSAAFTFHEFVAPVLRRLAGHPQPRTRTLSAHLTQRVQTARGRTTFLLVHLFEREGRLVAHPAGKGSGSVTSWAQADGFVALGRHVEYIEEGARVDVQLLAERLRPADLRVIGSHCLGLDRLLGHLAHRGYAIKSLHSGSQAGFRAAERGECDLAGVHLCDAQGEYNTPFVRGEVTLVRGYGRMQGVVFRGEREPELATSHLIQRNRGSGTRVLIDALLAELPGDTPPPGATHEARSHNAVAAAVAQGRADWGVAIEPVSRAYGLGFRPLREERYDFLIPTARIERPPVDAFLALLGDPAVRAELSDLGFRCHEAGTIVPPRSF